MKMNLGKRLFIGFAACLVLSLAIGVVSFIAMGQMAGNVHKLAGKEAQFLMKADGSQVLMLQHRRFEKDFFLNIGKPKKQDKYLKRFEKKSKVLLANLAAMAALAPAIKSLDQDMLDRIGKLPELYGSYKKGFLQVSAAVKADSGITPQKANQLMIPNKKAIHQLEETIDAACKQAQEYFAATAQADISFSGILRQVVLYLSLACLVLVVIIGLWITRWTRRDLTGIARSLGRGADQVARASRQVAESSQQLAEGASQQAASMEQGSASMEQMSSMTRTNAEHAGQADSLMNESIVIITQANARMKDLRGAMSKIDAASDEMAKIIKTIDEIAFQTNLLALNAAVEAARAGEAGAGFAVVADEVRNLAMRAAEAARNTGELIERNIQEIKGASDLVATTDDAFDQVEESAKKVSGLVSEIAGASNEQAQGIDQLNQAIGDMEQVTQQNAASAEESAAASQELNGQAEAIKGQVSSLVVLAGNLEQRSSRKKKPAGKKQKRIVPEPPKLTYERRPEAPAKPKAQQPDPKEELPLDDDFKDF